MSLKIIKEGVADTLQDAGRYGYQHLGINPSGAMDKYAMQVANALAGNKKDEAVIEIHFPASVFMFTQPALIALAGADFSASINGESIQPLHPIVIQKNDVLQFHKPVSGARTYLALAGGFVVTPWLASSSTNSKANAGGFNGRKLYSGDELFFRLPFTPVTLPADFFVLPWQAAITQAEETKKIFVLPGNEWNRLTNKAKEDFLSSSFTISPQSDRMGYCLKNHPLDVTNTGEIISAAVNFGTVQLLPDGQLIILMADHQTTGGYPRVAHIIAAHHSRLAQMKPGEKINFEITTQQIAEDLYIQQQKHLQQLQNACTFRLQEYLYATRH